MHVCRRTLFRTRVTLRLRVLAWAYDSPQSKAPSHTHTPKTQSSTPNFTSCAWPCCRAMDGVVQVAFCLFLECSEAVRFVRGLLHRRRPHSLARSDMHACVHGLMYICVYGWLSGYSPWQGHTWWWCDVMSDHGGAHFAARQDQRSCGRQSGRHPKTLSHVRVFAFMCVLICVCLRERQRYSVRHSDRETDT